MTQALSIRIVSREEYLERKRRLQEGALKDFCAGAVSQEGVETADVQAPPIAPLSQEGRIREWVQRQWSLYPPLEPLMLPETKQSIPEERPVARVTVEFIQRAVAQNYGIRLSDMHDNGRLRCLVRPRQVAMYLAVKMSGKSQPYIAKFFGGRDHTTILHGMAKIGWLIGDRQKTYKLRHIGKLSEDVDTELANRVARLEEKINEEWAQKLSSQI